MHVKSGPKIPELFNKVIATWVYKIFLQAFGLNSKPAGAVAGSLPNIQPDETTTIRENHGFRNHQENMTNLGRIMSTLTRLCRKWVNAAWGWRWSEKQWEDKLGKASYILFLSQTCYLGKTRACLFGTQSKNNTQGCRSQPGKTKAAQSLNEVKICWKWIQLPKFYPSTSKTPGLAT